MTPSNQTTRFLGSLRAVRRFSDRAIADAVLRDILEAGRRTGSSKNTQPWQIVVVRDREMLKRLSELGGFAGYIAAAQVDIVLVMDSANNAFDCGRLAERLMLAAWTHGIGSNIASLFPDENARKAKERDTGARGLRSIVEDVMLDIQYELPDMEHKGKYVVDGAVVPAPWLRVVSVSVSA